MEYLKLFSRRRRRDLWLVLASSLGLFLLCAWFASNGQLVVGEDWLINSFYNLPAELTPVVLGLTTLGSAWTLLALACFYVYQRNYSLALRLLGVGVLNSVVVEIAKDLVGRPRPFGLMAEVVQREVFVTGYGFPSGHTAMATALSLTLLPYLPKKWRWVVPAWIVIVALSRLYLGVHAPLDLIGGFAIGLLVAAIIKMIVPTTVKKRKTKLAKPDSKA